MAPASKPILAKAIAPTCAIAFVCFACLASILYVSEGNSSLKADNHWQKLDQEETAYADIKTIIARKKLEGRPQEAILTEEIKPRARLLASIYRQQGKQAEAAEIYRLLWLSSGNSPSFGSDARELASLYTDMAAFPSAVESYKKILQYDRDRLPPSDPGIARDLNNLGQCYYTAGCGTLDPKLRRQYFVWAKEQFGFAQNIAAHLSSPERDKVDQSIIQLNQALATMDLDNTQSVKNMEQSAMMTFGDKGR